MSDLPLDLQPIMPGQIEVALDTTHNRERLASLPSRPIDSPSPGSALAIPEREDHEDGWVSKRLERIPANTTQGIQRTSFISPDDGYYFNGVDQTTFLHGHFTHPVDEEATKDIIRGLNPELAHRFFDQKSRSPSAHSDSHPIPKSSESRGPSELSKSESRSHDQPESSRSKVADKASANSPASQDSALDAQNRFPTTGLDGAADLTPINCRKRARIPNSLFAWPPNKYPTMTGIGSRKRDWRIEKINADIGIFVQSKRGQRRPTTNSPARAQSDHPAPTFSPMPRTASLNRLKDFDEIERVDAERAVLWDNMRLDPNPREDTDDEYLACDRLSFRTQCGSYDYLKKGPAWERQVMKWEMEEWVNGEDEDEAWRAEAVGYESEAHSESALEGEEVVESVEEAGREEEN